jgi:hypothetical protein
MKEKWKNFDVKNRLLLICQFILTAAIIALVYVVVWGGGGAVAYGPDKVALFTSTTAKIVDTLFSPAGVIAMLGIVGLEALKYVKLPIKTETLATA